MRETLRNVLLSVAFLVVVATVLEVAVRLVGADPPARPWNLTAVQILDAVVGAPRGDSMFRSHGDLVWKLKSNYRGRRAYLTGIDPPVVEARWYQVATNSHGFRGDEFDAEQARERFLILCLGDSTTFGINADQGRSYPARLQHKMDQRRPHHFLVWNGGVPGYTSLQGEILLRKMPFPVEPDLLLIGYGHNDHALYWSNFEQMRAMLEDRGPLDTLREWLDHSAAYRAYKRLLVAARDRFHPGANLPTYDSYRKMIDWAEQHGTAVWLVAMNRIRPEVHTAIRMAAEERGVRLVDFTELFPENGGDALMSEEIHPNESGYDFMADALARAIEEAVPSSDSSAAPGTE